MAEGITRDMEDTVFSIFDRRDIVRLTPAQQQRVRENITRFTLFEAIDMNAGGRSVDVHGNVTFTVGETLAAKIRAIAAE